MAGAGMGGCPFAATHTTLNFPELFTRRDCLNWAVLGCGKQNRGENRPHGSSDNLCGHKARDVIDGDSGESGGEPTRESDRRIGEGG